MEPAEIFDRKALAMRRARAGRLGTGDFLRRHIAVELIERLAMVRRTFAKVLCLGDDGMLAEKLARAGATVTAADPDLAHAMSSGAPPLPDGSFDLVVSPGGLDLVADLPGTFALIRRALRPDGLFLAGFIGAGSLSTLRGAMLAADLTGQGGVAPRIHPQIDVRAAGDLLSRVGFALPVADGDRLEIRYAGMAALIADLRAAGATNVLMGRSRAPLTRTQYIAAHAAFAEMSAPDGRVTEAVSIVYLSGWAPSPDQPQPARRGSGSQSLAAILPRRSS